MGERWKTFLKGVIFPPEKEGKDNVYYAIYYGSTNINTKYNKVGCSCCFFRCSTKSLAVSSAT